MPDAIDLLTIKQFETLFNRAETERMVSNNLSGIMIYEVYKKYEGIKFYLSFGQFAILDLIMEKHHSFRVDVFVNSNMAFSPDHLVVLKYTDRGDKLTHSFREGCATLKIKKYKRYSDDDVSEIFMRGLLSS
jgi:hypothetical protein